MDTHISILKKLKCLRTHIVNFITYQLDNDLITEKRASQLAKSVLDQLTDNLTHPQIYQTLDKFKQDFPELAKDIDSALQACETQAARQAVDKEILKQVTQGNIDQALATLDQFKVK